MRVQLTRQRCRLRDLVARAQGRLGRCRRMRRSQASGAMPACSTNRRVRWRGEVQATAAMAATLHSLLRRLGHGVLHTVQRRRAGGCGGPERANCGSSGPRRCASTSVCATCAAIAGPGVSAMRCRVRSMPGGRRHCCRARRRSQTRGWRPRRSAVRWPRVRPDAGGAWWRAGLRAGPHARPAPRRRDGEQFQPARHQAQAAQPMQQAQGVFVRHVDALAGLDDPQEGTGRLAGKGSRPLSCKPTELVSVGWGTVKCSTKRSGSPWSASQVLALRSALRPDRPVQRQAAAQQGKPDVDGLCSGGARHALARSSASSTVHSVAKRPASTVAVRLMSAAQGDAVRLHHVPR